jgi:xylan 1,4-beta-xylosidase
MSYWTFSDVFEEQGVVKTPFYGGFGLMAEDEIPKPSLNAFAMLHLLGNTRIPVNSDSAIVTRRDDGSIVVALWNYAAPYGEGPVYTPPPANLPPSKRFLLKFDGEPPSSTAEIWRLDADHGNVIKTYDQMGRPAFPTPAQITQLRSAGQPAPPEKATLEHGVLKISIPAQGLVLVRIAPHGAAHSNAQKSAKAETDH